MKITRLEIKEFGGIRDMSIDIPDSGAIFAGGNGRGKTTVLRAIAAALAGQGIGPEAIRVGAERAEILIDLEALRVRRAITKKGSSLSVKNSAGDEWSRPQNRLREIFGSSPVDCLDFFLAPPKERRKLVMEALPVTVTAEDVARWAPGATKIAGRVSLEGHGLEVLERLYRTFYDVRAEVNRAAKDARAAATAALGFPPGPDDAPTLEDATKANAEAGQALVELQARDGAARKAKEASASSRARIEDLRARAAASEAVATAGPTVEQIGNAKAVVVKAEQAYEEAKKIAEGLREAVSIARDHHANLCELDAAATHEGKGALDLRKQAGEIEASLADLDAMAVPETEIATARVWLDKTVSLLEDAKAAAAAKAAQEHADALAARATKTEADAAQVDEIVRRLATDAPQELAQRSALIPGLRIDGETILLDGVSIDSLSGAEQLRFAVDLCRRLNASAKILICDGLERLDDESLEAFVTAATADGWQLLATRVSSGELVVEAISADTKEAA